MLWTGPERRDRLSLKGCVPARLLLVFFFLFFFLNFWVYLFIYLCLCWVFVSVRGLSLVAASGGHSSSRCAGLSPSWPLLLRSTGSRCAGSVNCGSRAQLLRGMWDLPRPGLEPVSPALAGRVSTTAPPGKAPGFLLLLVISLAFSFCVSNQCYTIKDVSPDITSHWRQSGEEGIGQ